MKSIKSKLIVDYIDILYTLLNYTAKYMHYSLFLIVPSFGDDRALGSPELEELP